MTTAINHFLDADLTTIKGVGKAYYALLQGLIGGHKVVDMLYHFPVAVQDRRLMPSLKAAKQGEVATFVVQVDQHIPPARGKRKTPYQVRCYHETGYLHINFFSMPIAYIQQKLPIGQQRVVSGKIEYYRGMCCINHPDYIETVDRLETVLKIDTVYPLKQGIQQKTVQKIQQQLVASMADMEEWLDVALLQQQGWLSWKDSLYAIHCPKHPEDIAPDSIYYQRLAYDELLAQQLFLQLTRQRHQETSGIAIHGNGHLQKKLLQQLPFELTMGQHKVIEDILHDQRSSKRMMRMLQGDVGSGKTVVALMAMLHVVEDGGQAALMAPTEILATQHYRWIESQCALINVQAVLLIGKQSAKERRQSLERIASGQADIIIGTHALFQDRVVFDRLRLAVIDEQHRFGVKQRQKLADKGMHTDILLMTATPIPRSLTITAFGDMECSRLTEKPANRKPITTKAMSLERLDEVVHSLQRPLGKGAKIYWICPLIEESEVMDLAAATERYHALSSVFPKRVGLVHGKMSAEERHHTMLAFRDESIDLLVATTVIEVGVDVPAATVMIIEQAERFGLSQLHQLRGRVGRSDAQSSCILLYGNLSDTSRKRLTILRESNDGFRIAEEDLRIRGQGDMAGTKQSGVPDYRIADFYKHQSLLRLANQDAKLILHHDPLLTSNRGKLLRRLLELFGYQEYRLLV